MRFWFDTEYIDDGRTIDLISLGVCAEDGREFYQESEQFNAARASAWVRAYVIPRCTGPRSSRAVIAASLAEFVGPAPPFGRHQFWADFGAHDWVALCWLYGTIRRLPNGFPWYIHDIQQWADALGARFGLPEPDPSTRHHALWDAREVKRRWLHLRKIEQLRRETGIA